MANNSNFSDAFQSTSIIGDMNCETLSENLEKLSIQQQNQSESCSSAPIDKNGSVHTKKLPSVTHAKEISICGSNWSQEL